MNERVFAVTVTYNRKELLRLCLQAILAQTRVPDVVMVINNASTDGTAEMLSRDFPTVEVITLPENVGGAGGFHAGMQAAYAQGATWIWLMDDDGMPSPTCLAALLAIEHPALPLRAPLVLQSDGDPEALAFPLRGKQHVRLCTRADAEAHADHGLLHDRCSPFNGLLIHRRVPEQIGFPKAEFFIWGDEVEFLLRALKAKLAVATLVTAEFRHPRDKMQNIPVRLLWRTCTAHYSGNPRRDVLIVRNDAYIASHYRGPAALIKHLLVYSKFYWQRRGWKAGLTACYIALQGAIGNLKYQPAPLEPTA